MPNVGESPRATINRRATRPAAANVDEAATKDEAGDRLPWEDWAYEFREKMPKRLARTWWQPSRRVDVRGGVKDSRHLTRRHALKPRRPDHSDLEAATAISFFCMHARSAAKGSSVSA